MPDSASADTRNPQPALAPFQAALDAANTVIVGKQQATKLAMVCLLARGHLLIEDVPGVGKTTLAHTLAATLGLSFSRQQFTSDLLPADILGVSIFDASKRDFVFHPGPIFSQMLLADEVNRASPKAQSALLEAMEEGQVSTDGITRALPAPFFVIATQNPGEQIGTFPLPESQLDRFLMRIDIGYPSNASELALLGGEDRRAMLGKLEAATAPEIVVAAQQAVAAVTTSEPLLRYVLALVLATRSHKALREGLSPRAGLGLKRAAQAHAWLEGRKGVLPEDVQAVFSAVVAHRLSHAHATGETADGDTIAAEILSETAIP